MSKCGSCIRYEIVAWARINERGDLYDLRTQPNPYVDPKTIVPLYRKVESNDINTK